MMKSARQQDTDCGGIDNYYKAHEQNMRELLMCFFASKGKLYYAARERKERVLWVHY